MACYILPKQAYFVMTKPQCIYSIQDNKQAPWKIQQLKKWDTWKLDKKLEKVTQTIYVPAFCSDPAKSIFTNPINHIIARHQHKLNQFILSYKYLQRNLCKLCTHIRFWKLCMCMQASNKLMACLLSSILTQTNWNQKNLNRLM